MTGIQNVADPPLTSVLPAVSSTIQNEIRMVTSNAVPAAIFDALQTMPKELENGLTPVIQRNVTGVVQASVCPALQISEGYRLKSGVQIQQVLYDSIQQILLPAMTSANSKLAEQLSARVRLEMIQ